MVLMVTNGACRSLVHSSFVETALSSSGPFGLFFFFFSQQTFCSGSLLFFSCEAVFLC